MGKGLMAFVKDGAGLLFQFLCRANRCIMRALNPLLQNFKQIANLFQHDDNPMAMCTAEMLTWSELYTLGYPAARRFEVI